MQDFDQDSKETNCVFDHCTYMYVSNVFVAESALTVDLPCLSYPIRGPLSYFSLCVTSENCLKPKNVCSAIIRLKETIIPVFEN